MKQRKNTGTKNFSRKVLTKRKRCADKMPTGKMPTGQNANRTNCHLKVSIWSGLFYVLGILSVPFFVWHFVRTISTCFGILCESWNSLSSSPPCNSVTCSCLLLTVVGGKVDDFLLLGWFGKNSVFYLLPPPLDCPPPPSDVLPLI